MLLLGFKICVVILKIGCYCCFKKWWCYYYKYFVVIIVLFGVELWLLFLFNFVHNFWWVIF